MRRPSAQTTPRVAAIVPAYNEQETLAEVLSALLATESVDEILVVSDGSDDDTVRIARELGARTLDLRRNHGKATAMAIGVAHTTAPILLFVDGDILNLSEYLLDQLIAPVVAGEADMNIGVRHRGWLIDAFHRRTGPLLSGIRCLRREVFEAVPEAYLDGFTVETALNWTCRQLGRRCSTVVLHGLKHLVKEKKRGLWAGARARCQMFYRVFTAWLELSLKSPGLRRAGTFAVARPELESLDS